MAEKRSYYEVMGVPKSASDDEVKKAYRKLTKQYHPGLDPGDKAAEAEFKEVNEAYEVLSDQERKTRYNQFGHMGVDPNFGGGPSAGPFDGDVGLGDIFNSSLDGFGVGRNADPSAPRRGRDTQASVTVSFGEAVKGTKKQVSYQWIELCQSCGGSGTESGTETKTYPQCDDTGQVQVSQCTPFGVVQTNRGCDRCGGKDEIIGHPYHICDGTERARKTETLEITIPAGINDSQILNVGGHSDAGTSGGPVGGLYVFVTVHPRPIFKRRGNGVQCKIPTMFAQAALGAGVVVPMLDGKVSYQVHDGTQPGDVFKLRDKGIPNIHGRGRGSQYIRVTIKVPKNLTDHQKEILKEFDGAGDEQRNYQKRKGFFDRIKDLFDTEEKE